nr:immunoglobulin heavy chain junction region [Macaca mulatta]MOW33264.1 immunoglobulin heavy chain junction region [Macaca mulatta]
CAKHDYGYSEGTYDYW